MRDIIDTLQDWLRNGEPFAIATVVATWGSSPRKVGSNMAVRADGAMVGSVSGGCVEGAVVEQALNVIDGESPQLLDFGVSDDTAWEVGLACGGSIEIFVQKMYENLLSQTTARIEQNETIGLLSCIEDPQDDLGKQALVDASGNAIAGDPAVVDQVKIDQLQRMLSSNESGRLDSSQSTNKAFFLQVISPPRKLVIIGGVHISIALAEMAKTLGFETIVVDPRQLFGSEERFPAVDRLIRSWPQDAYERINLDSATALAVLTHDPKIDDPAIIGALRSPVFYIGVLGSRRTHAKRVERLRQAGIDEDQLARLHAPIGLNIGAQSPEEIALSIMAEIVASQNMFNAS